MDFIKSDSFVGARYKSSSIRLTYPLFVKYTTARKILQNDAEIAKMSPSQ